MKNNTPTILLRLFLAILVISISLSAAKTALGEKENDYSDLIGKTCILQTGTEIAINLGGKLISVFVGNTYAVKVMKVQKMVHVNLWYAMIKFDTDLVRIVTPDDKLKLPTHVVIDVAGVAVQNLGGCK